jgi:trimethylamine--corrinoid protein Co-methyltransferase
LLITNGLKVLDESEIKRIVNGALQILENTGVEIANDFIVNTLIEEAGISAIGKNKIKIRRSYTEKFFDETEKIEIKKQEMKITSFAGVYEGVYLDPIDDGYKEWTEKRLLNYAQLAKKLPNIRAMFMLGCPLKSIPETKKPLYEKLYCWKYGIEGGESIWETELCPKIIDMWHVYTDEISQRIEDIFNGTVYLISPLKFGKAEAEQFEFFYKRGLRVSVGQLGSLGGTAPVTLAGALALHLAEGLFINIVNRVFFGDQRLSLYNSISTIDMSTGMFQYGRPEQVLLNIAGAQIAEKLGAQFEGHCGLSDAKVPGNEAGVQKVYSALFNAMACGRGVIEAGLLSVDEVCSPIQMILDDEITGAINHIIKGLAVDEETLALETIHDVGTGGNFFDNEHTALHFRQTLWETTLWSREMKNIWEMQGRKNDIDKAREKFVSIVEEETDFESSISIEAEKALMKIIEK